MVIPQTEIIITHDGVELVRKTVPPGEYVIGRSAECDIVVPTDLISRRHATLKVHYYQTLIEDLGSSNGTFIAGKQISECTRIFPGQSVMLGSVSIELRRTKTEDPSQTMSPHSETVQQALPPAFLREKKYTVGSVFAQGGMGVILEGQDNALRRRVAMKRMLNSCDQDQLLRFIEEAQVTAQLDHPNIVPVYELGVDEQEQVFYTMKLVRGITLYKVLGLVAQGVPATVKKYPLAALLSIFQKTCDALAFAHSKGVMHRDLKPENIMLGEYGEVFVMDWGLARASGQNLGGPQRTLVRSARQDRGQMTMIGQVLGTPNYMAPEQARGETDKFDARTDIYALGAILYHILALEPPVTGEDAGEVMRSVAAGEVAPFIAPGAKNLPAGKTFPHLPGGKIPAALAKIARKAMALDMDRRYTSVWELQADIEKYQGGTAGAGPGASPGNAKLLYAVIVVLAAAVIVLSILLALKHAG